MQATDANVATLLLLAMIACTAVNGFSAWTKGDIQQAKALSVSQKEKLLSESGGVNDMFGRPVQIVAEMLGGGEPGAEQWMRQDSNKDGGANDIICTKIVHFQRHGQGYHNLFGNILRDAGAEPDPDSLDPAKNPWVRPEIIDSPLTETGKNQCRLQRQVAALLNPELIVVSPLERAIQTAKLSFADFDEPRNSQIPWIAHEGCREELGRFVCNKRRPLSEIQHDYPSLQFHGNVDEDDTLWHPTKRESNNSKTERIYDFLVNFLAVRPETEIAVVGHSAWLFHMCNAVVDCQGNEDLTNWFLTSEIRSMRLTFTKRKQN